jgi:hypothetical protein
MHLGIGNLILNANTKELGSTIIQEIYQCHFGLKGILG